MIDFNKRSYQKELLDRTDIPFADIQQNMKELEFINTYLGGHSITIEGFKKLAEKRSELTVCEIGCGGGDNLNAIYRHCSKQTIDLKLIGIDINPDCIAFAKINTPINNESFITSDYKKVIFNEKPDIIFNSLFCHHFTNDELISMIQWMQENSKIGFFINDLERHPLAYHFIKISSRLFSRSYLVKNDAPLSVLRGFKKEEWKTIFNMAEIKNYTIQWKWAFRHLIIAKHAG